MKLANIILLLTASVSSSNAAVSVSVWTVVCLVSFHIHCQPVDLILSSNLISSLYRNPSSVRHPRTAVLTMLRLLSSAFTVALTMPSQMASVVAHAGTGSLTRPLSVPRIVCHRRYVMPKLSLVLTVASGRRQGTSKEKLRGQLREKCKCMCMMCISSYYCL